jgi:hypothetical protein
MGNKRKTFVRSMAMILFGIASFFILFLAIPAMLVYADYGVQYCTVHFHFHNFRNRINRISNNKITNYRINSGGDWDPYFVYLNLKTTNNYDVEVNGMVDCIVPSSNRYIKSIHIGKIANNHTGKLFKSISIVFSPDDEKKLRYNNKDINAVYDIKNLDDFIIKSDDIVDSIVNKIEADQNMP